MADRYSELNAREQSFIDHVVPRRDAHAAALKAGYPLSTARTSSYSWIKDPTCKPVLYETFEHRRREYLKGFEVEVADVRQRAWEAATTDATELVEFRRTCCRWCHGAGHKYQWTLNELESATAAAERTGKPFPSLEGGIGYNATHDPHPDCPECHGEGIETVRAKDSRDLTVGGRMIFKGVKRTKGGGFEVVTDDQSKWMKLFAELCGMTVKKSELTGKDGAPLFSMPSTIVLVAHGEDPVPEEAE